MTRRLVAIVLSALLGAAVLAGCGGNGSDVDCNLNSCTVTMDRGVDAEASVLGVDVKLVSADDNQVTLDVGGNQVNIPTGGEGTAQVAGLTVSVQQVTGDQVVLKITQGGN